MASRFSWSSRIFASRPPWPTVTTSWSTAGSSTRSPMPSSTPTWASCTTTSECRKGASHMTATRVLVLAAALLAAAVPAHAQISDGVIKIGIMNDQSGTYADLAGPGSVVAAKMAIEDFGAAKKNMKVEVLVADHQNKPDVGSSIARQWFDADHVDVIVDVPTSSVV